MISWAKTRLYSLLRWSERYTKTDMVYLASGNFWLLLGRFIAVGSGTLLTVAFANLFSPEAFGTYKYVLAIAGFIGAFSLGGLGGAVTRAIALGQRNVVHEVFRIGFIWSLPASIVALAGSLYYFINGNATLGTGLLLIALTNPLFNNLGLYKSVLLGEKDFRGLTLYSIPRSLIPIVAIALTLFLSGNVLLVLLVYFVSNLLVGTAVHYFALRKYHAYHGNEHVSETVTYGKHLSAMGAFSQMTGNLDQLLLWHFSGPAQLAIYSFALAPVREIRNFTENISPLILPKYVTKSISEMKQTVPLRIVQLFFVSLAIALLYILLAPFLYQYIFPQYVSAIFASQLLAAALIFQPRELVQTMLYAQGNTRLRYYSVIGTQTSKVLLWVILIPLYGFMGAAIGTVLSEGISSLILWWTYHKLS